MNCARGPWAGYEKKLICFGDNEEKHYQFLTEIISEITKCLNWKNSCKLIW
jgi:hypothetical protein